MGGRRLAVVTLITIIVAIGLGAISLNVAVNMNEVQRGRISANQTPLSDWQVLVEIVRIKFHSKL